MIAECIAKQVLENMIRTLCNLLQHRDDRETYLSTVHLMLQTFCFSFHRLYQDRNEQCCATTSCYEIYCIRKYMPFTCKDSDSSVPSFVQTNTGSFVFPTKERHTIGILYLCSLYWVDNYDLPTTYHLMLIKSSQDTNRTGIHREIWPALWQYHGIAIHCHGMWICYG